MKYKSFLIISALILTSMPVFSYAITEEVTSTEQMVNYNFSGTVADYVQLVKAQNHNKEYKSGRYKPNSGWRRFWEYIDPSADDRHLLQHDIKPEHSWQDW